MNLQNIIWKPNICSSSESGIIFIIIIIIGIIIFGVLDKASGQIEGLTCSRPDEQQGTQTENTIFVKKKLKICKICILPHSLVSPSRILYPLLWIILFSFFFFAVVSAFGQLSSVRLKVHGQETLCCCLSDDPESCATGSYELCPLGECSRRFGSILINELTIRRIICIHIRCLSAPPAPSPLS